MDAGQIIEDNEPEEFFNNLQNERTQLFLSQISAALKRAPRRASWST